MISEKFEEITYVNHIFAKLIFASKKISRNRYLRIIMEGLIFAELNFREFDFSK